MNLNFTAEQLKKWAELRDLDAITEKEYQDKKNELLENDLIDKDYKVTNKNIKPEYFKKVEDKKEVSVVSENVIKNQRLIFIIPGALLLFLIILAIYENINFQEKSSVFYKKFKNNIVEQEYRAPNFGTQPGLVSDDDVLKEFMGKKNYKKKSTANMGNFSLNYNASVYKNPCSSSSYATAFKGKKYIIRDIARVRNGALVTVWYKINIYSKPYPISGWVSSQNTSTPEGVTIDNAGLGTSCTWR